MGMPHTLAQLILTLYLFPRLLVYSTYVRRPRNRRTYTVSLKQPAVEHGRPSPNTSLNTRGVAGSFPRTSQRGRFKVRGGAGTTRALFATTEETSRVDDGP